MTRPGRGTAPGVPRGHRLCRGARGVVLVGEPAHRHALRMTLRHAQGVPRHRPRRARHAHRHTCSAVVREVLHHRELRTGGRVRDRAAARELVVVVVTNKGRVAGPRRRSAPRVARGNGLRRRARGPGRGPTQGHALRMTLRHAQGVPRHRPRRARHAHRHARRAVVREVLAYRERPGARSAVSREHRRVDRVRDRARPDVELRTAGARGIAARGVPRRDGRLLRRARRRRWICHPGDAHARRMPLGRCRGTPGNRARRTRHRQRHGRRVVVGEVDDDREARRGCVGLRRREHRCRLRGRGRLGGRRLGGRRLRRRRLGRRRLRRRRVGRWRRGRIGWRRRRRRRRGGVDLLGIRGAAGVGDRGRWSRAGRPRRSPATTSAGPTRTHHRRDCCTPGTPFRGSPDRRRYH